MRDVSDYQWRDFRAGLPQLAGGLLSWVLLSRLVSINRHGIRACHFHGLIGTDPIAGQSSSKQARACPLPCSVITAGAW